MEIKIQSLESIHEAAREFIAAMGDNTVFTLSVLLLSLSLTNIVRTKPEN